MTAQSSTPPPEAGTRIDAESPGSLPPAGARRILCVTSNFPRWAGDSTTPFVLHLARDLQCLGWTVDVLAPHAAGAARREVIDGVNVERFTYLWPRRWQTVCYQGGALINLRDHPLDVIKLPALIIAEWLAVTRRLARRDYALLHSHWLLPQGFVGVLAARILGIPHVTTVHGGDVFALRGTVMRLFKQAAVRGADGVTANSSVTETEVRALGPGRALIRRIPMGVSLDAPSRRSPKVLALRERRRAGNGPMVVFAGRLVEEKGVGDLLQAVRMLAPDRPALRVLVLGEGQDGIELRRMAHAFGLEERVCFMGWTAHEEVATYMAAADIFVNPSRRASNGWVEAQGLSILEAMAAGTPVIATDQGGVVDAVLPGRTGLLVPPRDPAALADAIGRLADEPDLAATLVEGARTLVTEAFSRERSAAAFSALFADLIARRGRR